MNSASKLVLNVTLYKKFYSLFGLKNIIEGNDAKAKFCISPVTKDTRTDVLKTTKELYFSQHVLMRALNYRHLERNCALDEFILKTLWGGNSLCATSPEGELAGVCLNCAVSKIDARNLKAFIQHRQDPKLKEFLYFTLRLQENPNLWDIFNENKIFEIKMLAVQPKFRRQGIGHSLVQKSIELAKDQGYKVVRMDCINPYDNKVAEKCDMRCFHKCQISELKHKDGRRFIDKEEFDCLWSVYIDSSREDKDKKWTSVESINE